MITRAEWRWVLVFAVLFMALTSVPYVVGAASQRDGWEFEGFLFGLEDGNAYLAKMRQGATGEWLNILNHTTEPQPKIFIHPVLHFLGWLAGPEPAALALAYHVARFLAGVFLLTVSYLFLARWIEGVVARRLALVLVAAGAGLGWLVTILFPDKLFDSLPLDFILPEAFSFMTLFGLMHLALARGLMLLALLAYLDRRGVWAGVLLLLVGLPQPLYIVVAWALMCAHVGVGWLLRWRRPQHTAVLGSRDDWKTALAAGLISAPMVFYNVGVMGTHPVLIQWQIQNRLPSPNPVHYLLAFGVLLAPAALGWRRVWARSPRLAVFAGTWVVAALVLAYAPIPTQRRLVEGIQLPLVALAVNGLQTLRPRVRRLAAIAVLLLTLPSTLLFYLGTLGGAARLEEPVFHPPDELAAFAWLRHNAEPWTAALAAYETGSVLPAYAPMRAYVGHGPESIFLDQKLPRVERFYTAGTPDLERRALLAEGDIDYVVFGPHEAELGSFDPAGVPYLEWRFSAGDYSIYAVVRGGQ